MRPPPLCSRVDDGGAPRRLAGIDLLHRQVGEVRDVEERLLVPSAALDGDQLRAADDARGAVEARD